MGEAARRLTATVAHADQSGVTVDGMLHWLHVLFTATLTGYAVSAKGAGAKPWRPSVYSSSFRGILMHDHRSGYAA